MEIIFDYDEIILSDFKKELIWYEEEFDFIFNYETYNYTNTKKLADQIVNHLINQIAFCNEHFIHSITSTLFKIENKHPNLF